jgi:hypothetical protein
VALHAGAAQELLSFVIQVHRSAHLA